MACPHTQLWLKYTYHQMHQFNHILCCPSIKSTHTVVKPKALPEPAPSLSSPWPLAVPFCVPLLPIVLSVHIVYVSPPGWLSYLATLLRGFPPDLELQWATAPSSSALQFTNAFCAQCLSQIFLPGRYCPLSLAANICLPM